MTASWQKGQQLNHKRHKQHSKIPPNEMNKLTETLEFTSFKSILSDFPSELFFAVWVQVVKQHLHLRELIQLTAKEEPSTQSIKSQSQDKNNDYFTFDKLVVLLLKEVSINMYEVGDSILIKFKGIEGSIKERDPVMDDLISLTRRHNVQFSKLSTNIPSGYILNYGIIDIICISKEIQLSSLDPIDVLAKCHPEVLPHITDVHLDPIPFSTGEEELRSVNLLTNIKSLHISGFLDPNSARPFIVFCQFALVCKTVDYITIDLEYVYEGTIPPQLVGVLDKIVSSKNAYIEVRITGGNRLVYPSFSFDSLRKQCKSFEHTITHITTRNTNRSKQQSLELNDFSHLKTLILPHFMDDEPPLNPELFINSQSLERLNVEVITLSDASSFFKGLPRLKRLTLRSCQFDTHFDFSVSSSLTCLEIFTSKFAPNITISLPKVLRLFSISSEDTSQLPKIDNFDQLQFLKTVTLKSTQSPFPSNFLHSLPQCLDNMSLKLGDLENWDNVDFTYLTQLNQFSLTTYLSQDTFDLNKLPPNVHSITINMENMELIKTLPSKLESLNISLNTPNYHRILNGITSNCFHLKTLRVHSSAAKHDLTRLKLGGDLQQLFIYLECQDNPDVMTSGGTIPVLMNNFPKSLFRFECIIPMDLAPMGVSLAFTFPAQFVDRFGQFGASTLMTQFTSMAA
ncbi:unnamed protein product [Ambrosiozyma monospora]|uniref:Unnamed protein product n=1 Tax=Ambrosiozyma monospora TaxID=43982 RepID=A0ACB5STV4_AMBMO|nr:unnamed protein product [Ambrosiozyma monospora]